VKSILLVLAVAWPLAAQAQDTIASLSASDVERGKKLYEGHCALCHGITGTGGKGPNLAQPNLRHAPDNARLAEVIRQGIDGSEMPGSWQLTDREIWQVAGFVRSLGSIAVVQLPGDPERGRALYMGKGGCVACHIVKGSGSSYAPELTEIGARRNAEYLRESIVAPSAQVPEGYLVVTVSTRDGKKLRGARVNEDTFTIQVRDASNKVHSFRKQDVAKLDKEFKQSLMPSYDSRFTSSELDDLIAYLASLRGKS
jgi:cytochrome c oxidase cbb3-type subunit 3